MVATSRIQFPEDMTRVANAPGTPILESYALETLDRVKNYARDEPIKFALWTFGIGFVLGWKMKPW